MFLLVLAQPGSHGQRAIKRLFLLINTVGPTKRQLFVLIYHKICNTFGKSTIPQHLYSLLFLPLYGVAPAALCTLLSLLQTNQLLCLWYLQSGCGLLPFWSQILAMSTPAELIACTYGSTVLLAFQRKLVCTPCFIKKQPL